jgi:predicted nucleic acid-binding protein
MKYAIDASVGIQWEVSEPLSTKACDLRNAFRLGIHELLTTDLFPTEVANGLLVAERRGRILSGQGAQFLANILTVRVPIHSALPDLLPRAYAIAWSSSASAYDCLYVALAEREQCEFVTADDKLVRSLQPQFPFVVALASLP